MKRRKIEVKNGKLLINGKPKFLYSGEIHYFRISADDWKDRLRKAKKMGLNTVSTYVPWRWHEIGYDEQNKIPCVDFTGASHPQRNLIRYIEETEKAGLDLILRLGPICNGEMRFEGLPDRIAKNPKTVMHSDNALHHSTAPNYLAREFLDSALVWLESLLPIVAKYQAPSGGPVTLVQLDNEIGMVHWLAGFPLISKVFGKYFGVLCDRARKQGVKVPLIANIPQFYDYDTRGRWHYAPLTAQNFEEFESNGAQIMGGAYQPRRLDADNCHDIHLATEVVRSIQKNSIAVCAETQTGILVDRPRLYPKDVHLLLSLASIAQLRGMNLYMLAGGSNPLDLGAFGIDHDWQSPIGPEGDLRMHSKPVSEFGNLLKKIEPYIAGGETFTPVDFAVPTEYYRNPKSELLFESFTHLSDAWARLFFLSGLPPRWIWIGRKKNSKLQSRSFKSDTVFIFALEKMSRESQIEAVKLIKDGHKVIIAPGIPVRDIAGKPCKILADFLSAEPIDKNSDESTSSLLGERIFNMRKPSTVKVNNAEILGEWDGVPAAFRKKTGRSEVTFIGFSLSDRQDAQKRCFEKLIAEIKEKPILRFESKLHDNPIYMAKKFGSRYLILVANMHETDWSGRIILDKVSLKEKLSGKEARFYICGGGRIWRVS